MGGVGGAAPLRSRCGSFAALGAALALGVNKMQPSGRGRQRSSPPRFGEIPHRPLTCDFPAVPKPFGDHIGRPGCPRDPRRGRVFPGDAGKCRVGWVKVRKASGRISQVCKKYLPSIRIIYVSAMNLVAGVNALFYETHLKGGIKPDFNNVRVSITKL